MINFKSLFNLGFHFCCLILHNGIKLICGLKIKKVYIYAYMSDKNYKIIILLGKTIKMNQ